MQFIQDLGALILDKFKAFEKGEIYVNLVQLKNGGIDDNVAFQFYIRRMSLGAKEKTYVRTPNMTDHVRNVTTKWRAVFKVPVETDAESAEESMYIFLDTKAGVNVISTGSDASLIYREESGEKDAIIDMFNLVCVDFNIVEQKGIPTCIDDICPSLCKTCK